MQTHPFGKVKPIIRKRGDFMGVPRQMIGNKSKSDED
jgi:hypothetical protein